MFAALMMIGANITAFVPFLVVGGCADHLADVFCDSCRTSSWQSVRGALAMTVYMFIGLAGAPVLQDSVVVLDQIISPTFGFIVSFILVAYIAGKIVEKERQITWLHYCRTCRDGRELCYWNKLDVLCLQILGCSSGCLFIQSGMALDVTAASERYYCFRFLLGCLDTACTKY